MRRTSFACLLVVASLMLARTSSAQSALPPTFGDWNVGQTSSVQQATLEQAVGADAPILREYGFVSLEHQDYTRDANAIGVTLYRMVDPTAAYGAFTYLRPSEMQDSKLAKFSAASPKRALIVVGNFLLDVNGERLEQASNELPALIAAVTPKADPRPFPIIAEHLPTHGLVPGSERYFLGPLALQKVVPFADGDWLGFSQGAEAILARYRKNGQEVTLLVAAYPTQRMAAKRFEALSPLIGANHVAASRRDSDLIALAFAPRAGGYVDALMGQIVFGHYVTWNEPAFKAKDLSWPTYVVGAFVGTGAICLIAIVSGLGFALIRVFIKIFFPGKIFDRHRSIEVLQLGLSGRRVDTKDFY